LFTAATFKAIFLFILPVSQCYYNTDIDTLNS